MTLKDLEIGKSAVITSVGGKGALRQHFLDMGMIPGAEVTVVKFAPMGDPMELQVHGYELTLRLAEAEQIEIEQIPKRSRSHAGIEAVSDLAHPGLGEDGKYHSREDEHPLPEGTTLTYALVGNQNCGKTTLFNQLTGSSQHVGNFPGVTVDRKTGSIKGHPTQEETVNKKHRRIFTMVKIVRPVRLKAIRIQKSQTFREFIPCPLTAVRRLSPEILSWMRNQVRSSTLWMLPILRETCI